MLYGIDHGKIIAILYEESPSYTWRDWGGIAHCPDVESRLYEKNCNQENLQLNKADRVSKDYKNLQ